ncbi:MAG: nucleotidyltransferase domain-containing protein [Chloroherpetonaceae bacterium]
MRLPEPLHAAILRATQKSFGDVKIYLFGSRVFDDKIGGDIDLAVDVEISHDEFRMKKARFLASLMREGYDLNFDVVPYQHKDPLFRSEIQNHAIDLTQSSSQAK